jgi:transcriptional regulator with XRE-family HTH domain
MAADEAMVARLLLAARLRALRAAAGITGARAAGAVGGSTSKISRIESAHVAAHADDVAALLDLYQAPGCVRTELLRLAREAGRPGPWDPLVDKLPQAARHHLSLESAADVILTYDPQAVPALLQVSPYAHALCTVSRSGATWRAGLSLEVLRRRRSTVTTGTTAPRIWALIGEPVLHRVPGRSRAALTEQNASLLMQAGSGRCVIQLVGDSAPAQLAAPGPFTLLRFTDPDLPDIVVLELATGAVLVERQPDVERYLEIFQQIAVQADTPEASRAALGAVVAGSGGRKTAQ